MNILVTINEEYIEQLNILLNSIKYSNPKEQFDIYILHNNLTDKDIERTSIGLDNDRFNINSIKISKNEIDFLPIYSKRYPIEIYFRIFAAKYLPKDLDRILYLDSDTLVINDLSELYNIDFEEKYFVAATHIKKVLHKFNEIRLDIKEDEAYINTGVLLMNLKALRGLPIEQDIHTFIKKYKKKLILPDQDIISSLYGDKIKLVDELKYNFGEKDWKLYNFYNPQHQINLKWICKNTVIIHYYGKNKPWLKEYKGRLGYFYRKIEKRVKIYKAKKVLILSCGTGGGHNSAALAVKNKLEEKGIETDFIEYLDIINPKIKNSVNKLYLKSTQNEGKVFKVVYRLGELYQKTNLKSPVYQLNSLNKKRLYKYIKTNQYDYIVTTHLFAAQALTAIKKDYSIHFIAIATDYVCIPFWEETNPDYFIIPSKDLEKDFEQKGIDHKKIVPLGIPVNSEFNDKYDKEIIKKELNFRIDKKYILILTGSMGFGNVQEMLKKLLENIDDVTFIISCGNNIELLHNLQNKYKMNKQVLAIPFTNEISKYMKSSDIILTKPGGLTTTEVATIRKPCIHTMPIPGCENYNAEFFSKRNMSVKCNTIDEVIYNTKDLLKNNTKQEEMIQKQKQYINENACDEIAEFIKKEMYKTRGGYERRSSRNNRARRK